jgi:hypothetical protein
MSGTFGTNRNKSTRLEGTTSILLTGFAGTSSRAVLNQPLGVLWVVVLIETLQEH